MLLSHYCSKCNTVNTRQNRFCPNCGNNLEISISVQENQADRSVVPASPSARIVPEKKATFWDVVQTGLAIIGGVCQAVDEAEKAARNYRISVRDIISPARLRQIGVEPTAALSSLFSGNDQEELKQVMLIINERRCQRVFYKDYSQVVLATFFALGNQNRSIIKIGDTFKGAYFRAYQPWNIWTYKSHIFIEITEENVNGVIGSTPLAGEIGWKA